MIKLMNISEIHASEYNPRKNDKKRLALTELSLRKLGFLLPVYIDAEGEILSGHQRSLVASQMGFKQVPVEVVAGKTYDERKSINILFNRATNDMQKNASCETVKKQLYSSNVETLGKTLPDIKPGSRESYPCVYSLKRMDATLLAKKNHRNFDRYICNLSKSLETSLGKAMPIVISESGEIINGIGRLQSAVESKKKIVQCVTVSAEQVEFARAMLNLLTMDFDMESTYADDLRYNSFMRERNTREVDNDGNAALGNGFFKGVFPNNNGRDFCKLEGAALEKWKRHYGGCVVDFGAGKLSNTRTLRKAGIQVSAFEPYFVTNGDKIHKNKSLEIDERFLDEVAAGTKYTTVFISSVFNSVPFMSDRKQIAIIAAALCMPDGMTVCWCQSDTSQQFLAVKKQSMGAGETDMTFALDYEPNIVLGGITRECKPKVQKGHNREEMLEIFTPCFRSVDRLELIHGFWYMEISKPTVDVSALAKALDFEFELPYPDGTRMGLSGKARTAFEHRLGIKLPPPEGD